MKLLTFCLTFVGLAGIGSGQAVSCTFESVWSFLHYRVYGYICILNTSNLDYGNLPQNIDGSHSNGRNDDDVEKLCGGNSSLKTLNSIFCKRFKNLEEIFAVFMKIESVDQNSFIECRNLKKLYLSVNSIKQLPENLLTANPKLEKFSIYDNKLTSIPENLFKNQKELNYLNLGKNQLSSLPVGIFRELDKLENLWLHNNKLKTLHSDSFGIHPKLKVIYLEGNRLNSLDERIIDGTAVAELNMDNNLCASFKTKERSDIKSQIRNCFVSYQPRSEQGSCGLSKVNHGTIFGGNYLQRGTYPWHAALRHKTLGFFCSGILISERKIITAAHCMQPKFQDIDFQENDFVALLGVHNLDNDLEIGRTVYGIEKIVLHPDYKQFGESFDADIAVLFLTPNVSFTDFIQPICMLNSSSSAAQEVNGVAVGYGQSENAEKYEKIPKELKMPIVENEDCIYGDVRIYRLSSKRTMCIGNRNGTGVCKGDSGGGLYVKYQGIYYLRGIISSAPFIGNDCDLNTYSVATNL